MLKDLVSFWATFDTTLVGTVPNTLLQGEFPRLYQVVLQDNGLVGTIPEVGAGVSNLSYLHYNSNALTGTVPWPSIIKHLNSSLVQFRFNTNYLTGSLPSNIGAMTKLSDMIMALNLLTGSLPSSFGSLENLRVSGTSIKIHRTKEKGSLKIAVSAFLFTLFSFLATRVIHPVAL